MRRSHRWLAVGLAILAAPVVGTFVYLNVLRDDPPPRLTLDDVTATTAASGPVEGIEGEWVVGGGSIVGYRVQELLFGQDAEAVGRTEDVTGALTVAGTTVTEADFEVDLTTVASDESRRDGQFQGRIMETAEFPAATFVLTAPIDLGDEPADGERFSVDATGELTLHGVTRPVTIPLTAERRGDSFAVDGSIEITFADHEIDNPSAGPAQVGDVGELEVLLVFER